SGTNRVGTHAVPAVEGHHRRYPARSKSASGQRRAPVALRKQGSAGVIADSLVGLAQRFPNRSCLSRDRAERLVDVKRLAEVAQEPLAAPCELGVGEVGGVGLCKFGVERLVGDQQLLCQLRRVCVLGGGPGGGLCALW